MTKINSLALQSFRNFSNLNLTFNKNLNILFGDNGSGKTNILEAISLLSKGRGFRNAKLAEINKRNTNNFKLNCELEIDTYELDIKVFSKIENNKLKKIIEINNNSKKEDIISLEKSLSFLVFLPEMERLFTSSPSYRRNFIDRIIFSENPNYNTLINKYRKLILERSKILQNTNYDSEWIKNLEINISNVGIEIYILRANKINELNNSISLVNKNNKYPFDLKLEIKDNFFKTNLTQEEYMQNLSESREIDRTLGGTRIGPHKSDFVTIIDGEFDGSFLSTGQQKTAVLILLIAQCNDLVLNKKLIPILLFDEICSHLDNFNRKILMDFTNKFEVQFFFTGTEANLFSFVSTNSTFYNITDL